MQLTYERLIWLAQEGILAIVANIDPETGLPNP
jgi:hypothetical protein